MIPQVTPDEVMEAVTGKRAGVMIIDVRTPAEYARGKIDGSLNVPVDQIALRIPALITDKTTTIYLYCLSGSRSDVATQTLIGLGYANAKSLTHGLLLWRNKQYPLIP